MQKDCLSILVYFIHVFIYIYIHIHTHFISQFGRYLTYSFISIVSCHFHSSNIFMWLPTTALYGCIFIHLTSSLLVGEVESSVFRKINSISLNNFVHTYFWLAEDTCRAIYKLPGKPHQIWSTRKYFWNRARTWSPQVTGAHVLTVTFIISMKIIL